MHASADIVASLLQTMGGTFSRELGIELSSCSRLELSKWFLAAKLFGARISSATAARTYREFERQGIVLPAQILDTGWDGLVGYWTRAAMSDTIFPPPRSCCP